MGKAKDRRKARQAEYLKRLAESSPEKFGMEWEKRLTSWLYTIHRRANEVSRRSPAVFAVLDEAMEVLKNCGKETFSKYGPETHSTLSAECCRAFSLACTPELYSLERWVEP